MCQQHCPPPFSGSSSHSRTMVRHSRSSAGSVCLAVAVVISCTMVCRNSFLFSALVRTFRKASLRERHMAHTRVPNRGSTGSALHPRDGMLDSGKRAGFPPEGWSQEFPFAQRFAASAQMLACLKTGAAPELYTLSDTVTYHCCIKSETSSLQSQSNGWQVYDRSAGALLVHGQQVVCTRAHLGLRPTGRMGASNKPFWVL